MSVRPYPQPLVRRRLSWRVMIVCGMLLLLNALVLVVRDTRLPVTATFVRYEGASNNVVIHITNHSGAEVSCYCKAAYTRATPSTPIPQNQTREIIVAFPSLTNPTPHISSVTVCCDRFQSGVLRRLRLILNRMGIV